MTLYLRMFLTMIVGLYTSRVVLATLGVEDFGIYSVVGELFLCYLSLMQLCHYLLVDF